MSEPIGTWKSHPVVRLVEILRDATPNFRGKTRLMNEMLSPLGLQRMPLGRLSIELDLRDTFERMAALGTCENAVTDAVRREMSPGETFCDVGANIGVLSIVLADHLGEGGQVYAFEPAPPTYQRLVRNFEALRDAPCSLTAVQAAVGTVVGTVEMHVSDTLVHSSLSTGFRDMSVQSGEHTRAVQVPATTLDEFFYGSEPQRLPQVVKIDVEGWEEQVVRGAMRLLREGRPRAVILERLTMPGYKDLANFESVDRLLVEAGYRFAEDLGGDVLYRPAAAQTTVSA